MINAAGATKEEASLGSVWPLLRESPSGKVLKIKASPQWDHKALCLGHLHDQEEPAGLLVLTGLCDVQARLRSEGIDAKEMIPHAESERPVRKRVRGKERPSL